MAGERYHYCDRCGRSTTHEQINTQIRCEDCKKIKCPHDLVEADGFGHYSCADCRQTFA